MREEATACLTASWSDLLRSPMSVKSLVLGTADSSTPAGVEAFTSIVASCKRERGWLGPNVGTASMIS